MRKIAIIFFLAGILFSIWAFSKGTNSASKAEAFGQQSFASKEADLGSKERGIDSKELRILSWNIQNLGKSKMANDSVMIFISSLISSYDIIAVQEISVSEFGSQAIAKLDDLLDRSGISWDYVISNPTSGSGSERYAYLFRKDKVQLVAHSLEAKLASVVNREPYIGRFLVDGNEYILGNVHLVPKDKNPSLEVKELVSLESKYKDKKFILMGDFNLSESDRSFDGMKRWCNVGFRRERTSLKMKEGGDWLNEEYDNFFISKGVKVSSSGVVHFYKNFDNLRSARRVSDHCPIFISIK